MQGLRAPCGRSQLDTSPVVESAIPDIIAVVVVVVVIGGESPQPCPSAQVAPLAYYNAIATMEFTWPWHKIRSILVDVAPWRRARTSLQSPFEFSSWNSDFRRADFVPSRSNQSNSSRRALRSYRDQPKQKSKLIAESWEWYDILWCLINYSKEIIWGK